MDVIRIVEVRPLANHRLQVLFNDGTGGIYAVEPRRRGGVFLKILPPEIFNAVRINEDFGCVEWPGGVDLCPTAMRQELAAGQRGEPAAAAAALA